MADVFIIGFLYVTQSLTSDETMLELETTDSASPDSEAVQRPSGTRVRRGIRIQILYCLVYSKSLFIETNMWWLREYIYFVLLSSSNQKYELLPIV